MIGNLASPNLAGRNEVSEQSGHPNERRLPMGKIEVAPRAIATIAARAVGRSYGVVGMAPHTLRAGVAQALRHEDAHKGVEVRIGNDEIAIDLDLTLDYGTRTADVGRNVPRD